MRFLHALALVGLGLLLPVGRVAHGQTGGFTYQGVLSEGGIRSNGTFDFRFALYGAATGGGATTQTVCADNVPVVDGLFAVEIPLSKPSTGLDAFLDIQVRADSGQPCSNLSGFTPLLPRPRLSAAPAAVFASAVANTAPQTPGALRFNPTLRQFEGYDGVFWYPFSVATNPILPSSIMTFSSPGVFSFTVPAGVERLGVDLFGAGGGGGARSPGTAEGSTCTVGAGGFAAGGGGGSGGSAGRFVIDVTPGELLTVHVGIAGNAGTSGPGSSGGASRVRRSANTVDIVVALGGNGGGYRASSVVMGSYSGSVCNGALGGTGANASAAASLSGSGTAVTALAGVPGTPGFGPSCRVEFPSNSIFCPAFGGNGGAARSVGSAADFVNTGGAGGDGAAVSTGAQAGNPGKVVLWWN